MMNSRHTIYDIMEAKGMFASNPANPNSRGVDNQPLYVGPVPYPKMFYHPEGLERVLVPGEMLLGPGGAPVIDWETQRPKLVGEQREIIWQIAKDMVEEERLRADGWHDHPAKALAAAGKPVPAMSSDQRIRELEEQARTLQAQLDVAKELREKDKGRGRNRGAAPPAAAD